MNARSTSQKRKSAKTQPESIVDLLRRRGPEFTASQETIAAYILDHITDVAYESADSLSKRLDISAATIGRFCRELGFKNFRDLKEALRRDRTVSPWLTGPKFNSFVSLDQEMEWLSQAYDAESMALAGVYDLPQRPAWNEVVRLLARAPRVWVVGFQIQRAVAQTFALQLQYLRPNVHLADMASGHYADVLEGDADDCVVIFDVHRYSRQSVELAAQVKASGRSLIVLTDVQNLWANEYTPNVLNVQIRSESIFWMSLSAMSSLSHLLLNEVVRALGDPVLKRLDAVSQDYRTFTGFSDQPLASAPTAPRRRTSGPRKPSKD